MNVAKLMKQKERIEQQIREAEAMEKNKNRVSRMVMKELEKHQGLFTIPVDALQQHIAAAFSDIAKKAMTGGDA